MNKRPLWVKALSGPVLADNGQGQNVVGLIQDGVALRYSTDEELQTMGFSRTLPLPSTLSEYMRGYERREYFTGTFYEDPLFIGEITTSRLTDGESIFLPGFSADAGDARLVIRMFPHKQEDMTAYYLALSSMVLHRVAKMDIHRVVVLLMEEEKNRRWLLEKGGFTSVPLENIPGGPQWACYLDVKEHCG